MAIHLNPSQFNGLSSFNHLRTNIEKANEALAQSLNKTLSGGLKIGPKQSAETTAKNILGFVQNGLNALRSQGASSERLEQRWQEAQKGIEKGYKDAIGMLKGLGIYDEELEHEVETGRSLVNEGMANLLDGLRKPAQVATQLFDTTTPFSVQAASNRLSLEVVTREGDRVNVSFKQSQVQLQKGELGVSAQKWNMEVDGNLSDAEREALTQLFNDVQSLGEHFFSGDMASAIDEAMKLGIQSDEIASMSLQLTQRSLAIQTPYSEVANGLPTARLDKIKAPLASYVDRYQQALDKAQALLNPVKTFNSMMQGLLGQEERFSIWQNFHAGLNAHLTK